MKNKNSFPNFLFRPSTLKLIIILLLLFNTITIAQEQTPPEEFYIGATFDRDTRYWQYYYDKLREAGMNILSQYANETTNGLLDGLNFLAYNSEFNNEWIYFYSTAYYSKWEAEEDQTHRYKVGFKHREKVEGDTLLSNVLIGSPDTLLGRQCWTTKGLSAPACSLMYGPHYHQEKTYKRWPDDPNDPDYDKYNLKYTPRFVMALDTLTYINTNDVICRLSIIARYRRQENGVFVNDYDQDTLLKSITLKASDFQPYGTFKEFKLIDTSDYYIYPPEFRDPENGIAVRDFSQLLGVHFFDRWGDQGVQFRVDWLGDNSKCNLYIDYVEVYDNDGGQDFTNAIGLNRIYNRINTYLQGFPQSEWSNMKYWGGCDEPSSLDDYIPLKTVDSILDSIGAPRLITTFYPWWEGKVNEDNQLVRYYNTVNPAKLIIDFFPFVDFRDPVGFEDWETTRKMFQICHTLDPDFYYQAAAFGYKINGNWKYMHRPDTREYKAQILLALAHGVKGIVNYTFNSLHDSGSNGNGTYGIIELDYSATDLYYVIKDTLLPRLKGKLVKHLSNWITQVIIFN